MTTTTQKLFTKLLFNFLLNFLLYFNFPEFASACKKSAQFISIHSSNHLVTRGATTIFDHIHPNVFLSNLNLWYQHLKKHTVSLLCSRDIFDLKSCNLIGQNSFGPVWLRNKLIDLLILPFAKKVRKATWRKPKHGEKLKMDSIIRKSNYSCIVLE